MVTMGATPPFSARTEWIETTPEGYRLGRQGDIYCALAPYLRDVDVDALTDTEAMDYLRCEACAVSANPDDLRSWAALRHAELNRRRALVPTGPDHAVDPDEAFVLHEDYRGYRLFGADGRLCAVAHCVRARVEAGASRDELRRFAERGAFLVGESCAELIAAVNKVTGSIAPCTDSDNS
jgi:hypothetical protein